MRIDFRKTVELSTDETTREAQRILLVIENEILMSRLDPDEKYILQISYRKSYADLLVSKFSVYIIQKTQGETVIEIKNLKCESWDVFDKIEEFLKESYSVNRYEKRPILGSRKWYLSIEF